MPAGDRLVSLSSTGTLPAPVEERVTALAQLLVDALPDAITEAQVAAIAAQAVSGVVAGAPGALDTLDELAAALGDDPNLATTLTAQIATRYTKPADGIPGSDLAAAVRTSLAKADLSQSATEVQALVAQAVSAVVAAAPGTLDTLDELAAAIGDDPNFAATFTALLAAKYAKPAGGIPATDLATATQATLIKADTLAYTGNLRGTWAPTTAYAVDDVVVSEGSLYRCDVAHTSGGASTGLALDREKWLTVSVPALDGASRVPVRRLSSPQSPGAQYENPATAGVFQRRPAQFDYSRRVLAFPIQGAADLTGSTEGTRIAGSAVVAGSGTAAATFATATRATPIDMSAPGGFVFLSVLTNGAVTGRHLSLRLYSDGADTTNYHSCRVIDQALDGNNGVEAQVSIPLAAFVAAGAGANLASIVRARLYTDFGSGPSYEVSSIYYHPPVVTKAKAILWLDDGNKATQRSAITIATKYGLPVTLAFTSDAQGASTVITADELRYLQDRHGAQITVHSFGPSDHGRLRAGAPTIEQLVAAQHFGLAMGFHGAADGAYWSPGFDATAQARAQTRRMFRSFRGGRNRLAETLPPSDPAITRAYMTGGSDTSVAQWQPYAEKAIAARGLAQFVWHDLSGSLLTEFETFCAWLVANKASIDVGTPATVFDPLCIA